MADPVSSPPKAPPPLASPSAANNPKNVAPATSAKKPSPGHLANLDDLVKGDLVALGSKSSPRIEARLRTDVREDLRARLKGDPRIAKAASLRDTSKDMHWQLKNTRRAQALKLEQEARREAADSLAKLMPNDKKSQKYLKHATSAAFRDLEFEAQHPDIHERAYTVVNHNPEFTFEFHDPDSEIMRNPSLRELINLDRSYSAFDDDLKQAIRIKNEQGSRHSYDPGYWTLVKNAASTTAQHWAAASEKKLLSTIQDVKFENAEIRDDFLAAVRDAAIAQRDAARIKNDNKTASDCEKLVRALNQYIYVDLQMINAQNAINAGGPFP